MHTPTDKTPEEIHFLLKRAGWTYADIDRVYKLKSGSACKAARYPHIDSELAISEVLGMSPRQIWPCRFAEGGSRLKPQPAKNYKPVPRSNKHQNKRTAA